MFAGFVGCCRLVWVVCMIDLLVVCCVWLYGVACLWFWTVCCRWGLLWLLFCLGLFRVVLAWVGWGCYLFVVARLWWFQICL